MSQQISVMLLGLTIMSLAGPHSLAYAQDKSPNTTESGQFGEDDDKDTIYQQDENGNWQRVPLNSLNREPTSRNLGMSEDIQPDVPDFFFSKLELDGTANDDWINLTASLTVHLVAVDRWVLVPMRFDQASLLDFKHSGPGDIAAPADSQRSRGLSWLLRGAGDHQLQMTLRVPLRKTPTGDLLQLELPEMSFFTGKLTLRLPSSSVTIRTEDNVRLLGTRVEEDGEHTILNADLPGQRIDLRWNIHEQQTEPVMQNPTDIRLRLLDEKIELTARQQIQFGVGNTNTLRVRLPSEDLELAPDGVRMVDGNGNERWVQPTPTDNPKWVTLPLGNLAGHVGLDWRFSTTMPPDGREFVVDGFEIADARRQSGTIAVESRDGFHVTQIGEDDIGVERMDVSNLPTSLTQSSQAYSFTGAQYRLRLRVEPTVPVISVTPYYYVKVSQDRVELEAIYQLRIDGGVVSSLPVIWSDEDRESWNVVASSLTGDLPRKVQQDRPDAPDEWEITLPNIVDNHTEVGLSAVRYFDTDAPPEETISLSLPVLSETRALSGWVIVSTDDDVEVTTRADEYSVLVLQSDAALNALKIPRPNWIDTQPLKPYRFSTNRPDLPPHLEMDLTVQSQTVTTSTVVEVHDLDDQPRISQRLSFDVQFGRLSQIRLEIPTILYDQLTSNFRDASLRFLLDGVTPLTTDWAGPVVTVTLPTARLGKFDIVIEDYLPNREHGIRPATLDVPIINSLDQPFSSVRLIVPDQPTLSVTVANEDWTRLNTVANGMHWITSLPVTDVNITLDRSLERSPQRLKIDEAYLQTMIDDAGQRVTHATYIIHELIEELVIRLPANAVNASFKWNGMALDSKHVILDSDSQQVRVMNPLSHSLRLSPQVVSLSYQSVGESVHWSEAQSVQFPVFASGVWIEQMWWELKLPLALHLFIPPSTMTPQFDWQRDGIFWERKPIANVDQITDSIRDINGGDQATSTNSGNTYLFLTLGSRSELRFRTMSKSGIVFLGAGLTLIASFLLLKVPAARHPLIWLFVWFVVMSLSLWYLDPMLLLLQPAAYGLILPICAALLDYTTNGRRRPGRRPTSDSTYREFGNQYESGFSGTGDAPVTSTLVRPTVMSDSGIDS